MTTTTEPPASGRRTGRRILAVAAAVVVLAVVAVVGVVVLRTSRTSGPGCPGVPTAAIDPQLSGANKALVTTFYDDVFNKKDFGAIDRVVGPAYTQHNPTVPDGVAGFRRFAQSLLGRFPRARTTVVQVIADNDLVLLHSHAVTVPGTPGRSMVDIFRVAGGRVVEHWDVGQDVAPGPPPRHDLFATDGGPGDPSPSAAANRALVVDWFTATTTGGRACAIPPALADDLVQHDPAVADGAAGQQAHYSELLAAHPQLSFRVARVLAEGDLVAIHANYRENPDDLGQSVVDIYRVRAGRIVEHWSTAQNVPATAVNGNGVF